MSMIFKWYKADFGPPDVMLPWLLQASRLKSPCLSCSTHVLASSVTQAEVTASM